MNLKYSLAAILTGSLMMGACMDDDWSTPQNILDNPPYGNNTIEKYTDSRVITVAQLKNRFETAIKQNKSQLITEDLQLQVVVNGNDAGGNIYKQVAVQDHTGGIIIGINATDQCAFLPVGQKLLINLKDLHIGGYGTQPQLGALFNGRLGRMDLTLWQQHVRLVKDDVVSAKVDTIDFDERADAMAHTGRIIRIKQATVSGGGTQTLAPDDGTVPLTSNCANRNINNSSKVVLRTSSYSDFAALPIPKEKVDIYGVCTVFNGTWQILMRTETDLQSAK